MESNQKAAVVDTAASVCWFLMDACWMLGLAVGSAVFAVPTLVLSLLMFRYTERSASNLLVTGTMCSWASMNVCVMLSELGRVAYLTVPAYCFLVLGTICLLAALILARGSSEAWESISRRFRRLRINRK